MKRNLLGALALSLCCGTATAADGFNGLSCDMDIAKALKGRHMPNGPVEATDAVRKALALEDMGGDELDWGSDVWWKICGSYYSVLIDQHAVVRDAVKLTDQPGTALAFQGSCKGGPKDREVTATVEDKPGATDLPAKAAWLIDDAKKRYVPVPVDGMLCPRGDGLVGSWKK